jgi:hypothetical protein
MSADRVVIDDEDGTGDHDTGRLSGFGQEGRKVVFCATPRPTMDPD